MIVNLSLAIVSALFLVLAIQIETSADDLWGPKIAPLFLAGTMLILSVVAALGPILRKGPPVSNYTEGDIEDSEPAPAADPVPVIKIVWVLLLGAFYFFAISMIGYLLSTVICLFLILLIFENTNLKKASLVAVVGAAVYYIAFIRVLGIYDPGFKALDFLSGSS